MLNTVRAINNAVKRDLKGFIAECEKEYHDQIESIAASVCENGAVSVIMLAGPSASGKTTTAHILRDKLTEKGRATQVISLDNFYLTADSPKMPILENGRLDFESVYSLDLDEIRLCINSITKDGFYDMPIFDFISRSRKSQRAHIDVRGGGIVIIEGLHALNPLMLQGIDPATVYKIYISVNTPLINDNGTKALSSRQIRLIRRSCRDRIYRGADLYHTLKFWTAVVEGERKYLYIHKDTADIQISTLHSYELCVLRNAFLEMVENLESEAENYEYVMSAAKVIENMVSLSEEVVPWDSLIREFTKGGKYENL